MKVSITSQVSLLQLVLICYYLPSILVVSSYSIGKQHERTNVILYHKPADVVTTHAVNDVLGRKNVFQDISTYQGYIRYDNSIDKRRLNDKNLFLNLHAVGRLDADTTGLLLLTNDGGLVHHVTNKEAASHRDNNLEPVSKTYEALIMGHHTQESSILEPIHTTGVDIGKKYGGLCQPVKEFTILDHPTSTTTLISLTLIEGKNRQVRRMFHAVGSGVMKLKRTRIGSDLTLNFIEEPGQWRFLSDAEIKTCLNWDINYDLIAKRNGEKEHQRRRRKR